MRICRGHRTKRTNCPLPRSARQLRALSLADDGSGQCPLIPAEAVDPATVAAQDASDAADAVTAAVEELATQDANLWQL